jgi:UDP-GlcNAc:undecaprenyl-phosphate GlcNAc-1-phosphate transferase
MNNTVIYFVVPIVSLVLVTVLMPIVRKIAIKINLVDKPNFRKVHKSPVPLAGGILVVSASLITLLIFPEVWHLEKKYYSLFFCCIILLFLGIIDDKKDLRWTIKFSVQIALAWILFDSGIKIESMFGIFGINELPLTAQYLLTLTVIVGVVNAFNLMDGIDGLAAGLAILGLSAFTVIAFLNNNHFLVLLYLSLIGSLIGFLRFNLSPSKKVFMGDSGALVLGLILVSSGIILIQEANNTSVFSTTFATILGVLALPVADSLRVYRRRFKNGSSPFKADKMHFHHMVLYLGLKHKRASFLIVFISFSLIVMSLVLGTLFSMTFMIIINLIVFIIISEVLWLNRKIKIWRRKIKKLETSQNLIHE